MATSMNSIKLIDPSGLIIADTQERNQAASSSADLMVEVKQAGKAVTSSAIKGFETFNIIQGLKMNIWRQETGAVSSTAINSSSFLGMDNIEFALACSDFDITAITTLANGQNVDFSFVKTGTIGTPNKRIEQFDFSNGQIVRTFFWLQENAIPSITICFKPKQVKITRFDYDWITEKPKGQKVYTIDFTNGVGK